MHSAGAALGDAASKFRTGQTYLFADDPEKRGRRICIYAALLAIQGEPDHARLPFYVPFNSASLAARTQASGAGV